MKKRSDFYWSMIIIISGLLALTSVFGNWGNPFRWILVLWFLLFCPGLAFAHLLPGKDQIGHWFLVIVLSFTLDTTVAETILYLDRWSPRLILLILLGICVFGVLTKLSIQISHQIPTNLQIDSKETSLLDLGFYLGSLRRGWRFILISALVALNLSLIHSYYIATPMYEATAKFIVRPNLQGAESADGANIKQTPDQASRISAYAAILNSPQIADETIKLLHKNASDFVKYKTSVNLIPEENIIQLTVSGSNPEIATMLTNSLGQYAIIHINNLYESYHLDFLDRAVAPTEPARPNFIQDGVIAILIGLIIGFGLAIFYGRTSVGSVFST